MRLRVVAAGVLLALAGCATPTPEWLSAKHKGFCVGGADETCLAAFAETELKAATEQDAAPVDVATLAFGLASLGAQIASSQPESWPELASAYSAAGAIIAKASSEDISQTLALLVAVAEPEARTYALSRLLMIHAQDMTEVQLNSSLNAIHEISTPQYKSGLSVKLSALLADGDYERADTLAKQLLSSDEIDTSRPFSMLALVVATYAMAGLADDAWNIARSAIQQGADLTMDDKKLITVAVESAKGNYPSPQYFYDFESDSVRLQAYLTVATLAYRFDQPKVRKAALSDAVRFIQKSSSKVNRAQALGHVLYLSNVGAKPEKLSTESVE